MTDAEREAQIRARAKGHSYLTDNEFLLLRLLDEARARISEGDAIVIAQRLEITEARAEIGRLTAPPGASAMERAFQIIRAVEFHLMRSDDEESGYPEGSKVVASAIEQAQREARAEYVETSRKLRAEAVSAAKAEARAEIAAPLDAPTDEELGALIKPLWLKVRPTREAQAIRSSLSVEFDDPRWESWAADFIPDYVWDLVDIAAQRGINGWRTTTPGALAVEQAARITDYFFNGWVLEKSKHDRLNADIARAIEQAQRET